MTDPRILECAKALRQIRALCERLERELEPSSQFVYTCLLCHNEYVGGWLCDEPKCPAPVEKGTPATNWKRVYLQEQAKREITE